MSTPFAEAFVEIAVDNARLRQDLNESKGIFQAGVTGLVAGGAAAVALGLMGAVKSAITGAFGFVSGQLGDSLGAAIEAEDVDARLNAVLKATGDNAGFAADQLNEMASALEAKTVHDDESIKSAQAVLLTFKNLKGDQFQQATVAAADLASFLGTDMVSAARSLGRAMEDPETGLRALRQAGVVFTDSQMGTIKAMLETGDVAKAQQMVLDGVADRIGGVGEAMAGTFSGAMRQASNTISNFREELGKGLLPLIRPLIDQSKEFFAKLIDQGPVVQEIFANIGDGIKGVGEQLGITGDTAAEVSDSVVGTLANVLDWLSLMTRGWDRMWATMGELISIHIDRGVLLAKAKLSELWESTKEATGLGGDVEGVRNEFAKQNQLLDERLSILQKQTAAWLAQERAIRDVERAQKDIPQSLPPGLVQREAIRLFQENAPEVVQGHVGNLMAIGQILAGLKLPAEVKKEEKATFSGLTDLHKQVQQGAASKTLLDLTKEGVAQQKEGVKVLGAIDKKLGDIAGRPAALAVFAA